MFTCFIFHCTVQNISLITIIITAIYKQLTGKNYRNVKKINRIFATEQIFLLHDEMADLQRLIIKVTDASTIVSFLFKVLFAKFFGIV